METQMPTLTLLLALALSACGGSDEPATERDAINLPQCAASGACS